LPRLVVVYVPLGLAVRHHQQGLLTAGSLVRVRPGEPN